MSRTRIFSTPHLITANGVAKHHGKRILTDEVIATLDPDGTHVVPLEMVHERGDFMDIRCVLLMKMKGTDDPQEDTIDIPIDQIDTFSSFVTRNEDGVLVPA